MQQPIQSRTGAATVHPAAPARLARQLDELGLDGRRVLLDCGLHPIHLEGQARAPRQPFLEAKAEAARRLADPCLGLRLGASTRVEDLDVFGAAIIHAPDVETSTTLGRRFLPVWESGTEISLARAGERVRLRYRNLVEGSLAATIDSQQSVIVLGKMFMALTKRRFAVVCRFACAAPVHSGCRAAASLPGFELRFEQDQWSLDVPARALNEPSPDVHPAVSRLLLRELEQQQAALALPEDIRARVRAALERGVGEGRGVGEIGAALGMSARTLQKHLIEAGTTFSAERDRVRLDVARGLLAEGLLSVEQIAARVGFASVPGFSRFFSRNAGMSPSEYRARIRG